MSIDLGDSPEFPPPTLAQKNQIRETLGINAALAEIPNLISRREFGGGVRLTSTATGEINGGDRYNLDGNVITFSIVVTPRSLAIDNVLFSKTGAASSLLSGYYLDTNGTALTWVSKQVGTVNDHYRVVCDTAMVLDQPTRVTVVANYLNSSAPSVVFYLDDGAAEPQTVSVAATGTYGDSADDFRIGRAAATYSDSVFSDFAVFNTALTASQAQSLYELGTEGFLGENPSLAAGAIAPTATYESDFSAGVDGWLSVNGTLVGNVDAIGGVDDALEFTSTAATVGSNSFFRLLELELGDYFRVEFDGYIPSSNSVITEFYSVSMGAASLADTVDISGVTVPDTWQTYTVQSVKPGVTTSLFIRFSESNLAGDGTGDVAYIKNIKVTEIELGALAHLPLTDDCRQLRDRSPNRYDAVASATGVTHLKRAEQHTFRTDTGTTASSPYLVAAEDILAANEVVTGVIVDGRYYAATGAQTDSFRRIQLVANASNLEVKRSNGTTVETIATATPASLTAFKITVLTSRI